MSKQKRGFWGQVRQYFLTGLTVFLPVLLTVYTLVLIFNFIDGFLAKFFEPIFTAIFGFYFKGISSVIFVILILIIGFLVTNFFGRRLYPYLERQFLKLPFFRQVYPPMKEIAAFLFSRDKPRFKQVVIVEYPRKGIYSLGFLMSDETKKISRAVGKELLSVLIPSSPSPFTGFVILVAREDIISTDITVEQAVKFIISDGVVNPN